jgi:conserved domain protein (fragment)
VVNLRQQLVGDKYGLTGAMFNSVSDATKLNELFKAARIQNLRAEQSQYWDIMDLLYHQLYVETVAATDNCAKNTYPYNFNAE